MKLKTFAIIGVLFCTTMAAVHSEPKHPPKQDVTTFEKGNVNYISATAMEIPAISFEALPVASNNAEIVLVSKAAATVVYDKDLGTVERWQNKNFYFGKNKKQKITKNEADMLAQIELPPAWA